MQPNQNPMRPDSKNLILATVLSMAIIFAWQFFFTKPQLEKAQQQAQIEAQAQQAAVPGTTASNVLPRDQAVAAGPRVKIDTPEFSGSINLTGAALDDLTFKTLRVSVEPGSPNVTLLTPSGAQDAYFAESGFVAPQGSTLVLPDAKTVWTAPADAVLTPTTPVTLTYNNGAGLAFQRQISVSDQYVFTIKDTVTNSSQAPVSLIPYARIQRQDTPHIQGYTTFYEGMLGVQDGSLEEATYKATAKDGGTVTKPATGGWLGFTDKYWATALIPNTKLPLTATYQHFMLGARDAYQVDWLAKDAVTIAPGTATDIEAKVFAGAKDVGTIRDIGTKYGIEKFDLMIDWGWFGFLTRPMYALLHFAKGIMGNFGLAILLVTVLVKLAVFPLANKSYASMSKMKKLQPAMEQIKAQFPDDKVRQQQEIMEMYKREKVSPLSGCLPIAVQIPIFFALYKVILTSIDLRHAPFYGWIHDLSAQDPTSLFNLFGLLPFTPPHALMIGIWPLLMGVTMWVQMRLNPAPADPVQASMFNWMPLIFTYMMASMPAGLVIYWSWSNLLSIIQQSYIMKRNGTEIDLFGNIRNSLPFLKKKQA
ncbi:MAG: membrane protein insertase YidC [Hyphomicrobiales bacterium]